VPRRGVDVDLDGRSASMIVRQLRVVDAFNVFNSLSGGDTVRATTSFQVHWRGTEKVTRVRDRENDFAARLIEATAAMRWHATSQGVRYRSIGESTNVFSEIGRERSGIFFD
jgi:hypothetical protein